MLKLFSRRRRPKPPTREIAPQWTTFQRSQFEHAAMPPANLPYATYAQMETDAMIQTALGIKRLGVLATPYRIVPHNSSADAQRVAAFVEETFGRMHGSPETILLGAMDAFSKGWSVQELVWELRNDRLRLREVKPKDPAQFGLVFDAFGNLERLKLQIPGELERELPRGRFAVYFNRPNYARAKGKSDLDAAFAHWQAKSKLLAAWQIHLERYASPTVLGRFERGLSSEEQAAMLAALRDLHLKTAIVHSDEYELTTLGGQKEPSTGFMEAIEFHNREIARSILGQTLTTDEGRRVGSPALGKVHLQVLLLQLEGIRRELADSVMTEQIVRPIVELNFGPGPLPRFEFIPSPLDAFAGGGLD